MMQPEQLQRLMRLARKTKSPLIVTDPEGAAPMVLMDIDRYESLMANEEDDAEWTLDELPEEFFSEPVLKSVSSPEPEVDFAPPYKADMVSPTSAQAEEQKNEDPGEEQFYLEPIE